MESNDIIKALEDWIKNYDGSYVNFKILGNALDLIIRQQAEYENLKVENQSLRSAANSLKMHYEEAQAEIKRLRKEVNLVSIQFQDLQERYEEAQAEIEKLKDANNTFEKAFHIQEQNIKDWLPITVFNYEIKTEAVKEFAEKVKEFMHNKFKDLDEYEFEYITERDIDNLLKETEGEV